MAEPVALSFVWEAMDLYFREVPEGNLAIDTNSAADKQLQAMAEAVIAGRPQDIRLQNLVEPSDSFNTRKVDTRLDFNRFIDVMRIHNQLELVLQNPVCNQAAGPNHPLYEICRQQAVRTSPSTPAEAEARENLIEEAWLGVAAQAHRQRSKAPEPPSEHIYLDVRLSDPYPDPKKPFRDVHGSVSEGDRRPQVYNSRKSKQTGGDLVGAMIQDVPHFGKIGAATIGMYSYLLLKETLSHNRQPLDIALWHTEIEWENVSHTPIQRSQAERK